MKSKTNIGLLLATLLVGTVSVVNSQAQTCRTGRGPALADSRIATRSEWGARAPSCGISTMSTLNRVVIHHTANASDFNTTDVNTSKAKVRAIQNYHMDVNGWCDIGYHFLVCKLGFAFEGRSGSWSSRPRGAHDSINENSFGFNFMGYFHTPYNQSPTLAQRDTMWDVIAWRMPTGWCSYGAGYYDPNHTNTGWLTAHRRVFATACPGDNVFSYIGTDSQGGIARNSVNDRRTQ